MGSLLCLEVKSFLHTVYNGLTDNYNYHAHMRKGYSNRFCLLSVVVIVTTRHLSNL